VCIINHQTVSGIVLGNSYCSVFKSFYIILDLECRKEIMTADTESCANKYEYYIYAGLGFLLIVSEALGITKGVQPNSLLQVAGMIGSYLASKRATPETVTHVSPTVPAV